MKSLHQFFRAVHDPTGVEVPGTQRLCAGLLLWVPVSATWPHAKNLGEMFPTRESASSSTELSLGHQHPEALHRFLPAQLRYLCCGDSCPSALSLGFLNSCKSPPRHLAPEIDNAGETDDLIDRNLYWG